MREARIAKKGGGWEAGRALITESVSERVEGWLPRKEVQSDEALLIAPCAAIHTLGLRFSMDLAFLNAEGRVTKVVKSVKPNRAAFGALSNLLRPWASQCLELPEGRSEGLRVGDEVEILRRDR